MKAHASLLGLRAGLALALLLGFYALALALIAVIFGAVAGLVVLVVAQDRVPPAGFAFVVVALLGGAFSLARGCSPARAAARTGRRSASRPRPRRSPCCGPRRGTWRRRSARPPPTGSTWCPA
ncbi:hypothetical protein ACFQHO_17360 [Actinomadura yumaensis]|uniref:hypothetical protein n=1 Tax=Actinomadura yumaensis TaxID=111807 RepID=UPI00362075F4